MEEQYLNELIHSTALIDELQKRIAEFDAIVAGPYLSRLTCEVARKFPDKAIILPCFHDEPLARLQAWRDAYGEAAGIFFHSPQEQEFAQAVLGINVPGSQVIGTVVGDEQGDPQRGRQLVGTDRPYVVYCGRYHPQKRLPELIAFADQYRQQHPDRFAFVFMG
ncbi:MAG: hypothetical protein KatS3mg105_4284 [Gemmatales bacterium]|nr:MAG: hypothetical protein KatS3mg105_4284 [Gemmatales bacterium]